MGVLNVALAPGILETPSVANVTACHPGGRRSRQIVDRISGRIGRRHTIVHSESVIGGISGPSASAGGICSGSLPRRMQILPGCGLPPGIGTA